MGVPRQTLASYRAECQRNVHDSTNRYWSIADWTFYINQARDQVASDAGCIRRLQTCYLSAGLEQYPIGGVTGGLVTAGGSGYTTISIAVTGDGSGATAHGVLTAGALSSVVVDLPGEGYTTAGFTITGDGSLAAATATVLDDYAIDIMNISVYWGNRLIPLGYQAFTEFNAKMRVYQVNYQYPAVWSRYGTSGGSAFLRPVPAQPYRAEFDTAILPDDLVADVDIDDQVKYPYSACVAYYACSLAKMKPQAYAEAEAFAAKYRKRVLEAQASIQMRRIPNAYHGYSGG